jgi:uncharacterized membrane protein YccF (DUF307 family)
VFAATSVIGWAFLLTGASDAGRRVFLALLALCSLQMFALSPPGSRGLVLVMVAVGLVAAVRGPREIWRRYPLGEFLLWLAVLGAIAVVSYSSGVDTSVSLYKFAGWVVLLAIPLWVRLGRDTAAAGIDLGRSSAALGRRNLPTRAFLLAAAFATMAWPVLAGLVGPAISEFDQALSGWLAVAVLVALPLCFWCVARLADGRWDVRSATLAISLNVSFAALSLSIASATYNTGLFERLVGGLLPPVFMFVILAAYDVVAFGAREAEREGRLIPRSGRVPVYFGALLLVIGSLALLDGETIIRPAGRTTSSISTPDGALLLGILFLGIPRYVRAVRKEPERFIAPEGVPGEPLKAADGAARLGRPGRMVRVAWFFVAGWWLSVLAILIGWFLILSIVGAPMALRIFARLPTWLTLQPKGPGPDLSMEVAPAQREQPLLVRAFYLVTIGWWLGLFWMLAALTFAVFIVTLPLGMRMLNRLPTVMTLKRIR